MSESNSETKIASRPCPVCQSHGERMQIFRQRFHTVDGGGLMDGYDVSVCSACGAGFADGIPEQSVFDEYYRSMSKYENHQSNGQISESYAKSYREIVDRLEPHIPQKDLRIVDVGCAAGGLLAEFKKRGYTNLLGVDPSPSCAVAADRHFGIRVVTGTIADMSIEKHAFDFVLFTGVLEHVRDVNSSIAQLSSLIAPNGKLVVAVPDVVGYEHCKNAPFQQFSVEHINFFSPISLTNLMKRHGFEKIAVWQTFWDVGIKSTEAVILAIYELTSTEPLPIEYDSETGRAAVSYVNNGQIMAEQERARIRGLMSTGRPFLVWGVGTLTQRLLATTELAQANIAAFVDSNRNYSGKVMLGKPIISPAELANRTDPILICSWMFQKEIENQIREVLNLKNDVIVLYDV